MYQVLRGITGSRAWAAISPGDMLDVIADAIFRSRASTRPCRSHRRVSRRSSLIGAVDLILERRVRARGGRGVMCHRLATEHLSKWYGQVSGSTTSP